MDFTTASRIAEALNKTLGGGKPIAHAENSRTVTVAVPASPGGDAADFIAQLETVTVEPDSRSRVIVNKDEHDFVMGKQVHVSPVAIMHGNLSVEVQTKFLVSQPEGFSQGTTQVVPEQKVTAQQEKSTNGLFRMVQPSKTWYVV